MPRGLWDEDLIDDAALRLFAYRWFHNLKNTWINTDFKEVFGKREGRGGHDEPVLDDDRWDMVDKATKSLDGRFAAWLKTK